MIKIDNNTPADITWTQNNQVYVVAAMQKDGTYVYGRAGTYKTGTLPTGVASLTCTKTSATCEPTSQTGTVANNAAIYHGDRLYWTATASPYYTVSVPYYNSSSSTYFTDFKSTRTATGVSLCGVTAERATRSVTATINDHISSIAVSFTKKSDGGSGSTIVTSSGAIADVWQGGAITYTVTPDTYWTASGGSYNAGTSAITIAPTASRAQRSVIVGINTNVSSVTVNYKKTSDGSSGTTTVTSSGPVTGIWQGDKITYTGVGATYWTVPGGTVQAGSFSVSIAPTATRTPRIVSVTKPGGAAMTATGIAPSSGSSQTVTVPTATNYKNNTSVLANKFWQGNQITWSATAPSGMVILPISGTISAGTGTAVIKTEVVKQRTTIISTSQSVMWTALQPSVTKTMSYGSMSAGAASTLEDRDSIYLNGTWYPARPSATGTAVAILDQEVPLSATASSPAIVAAYGSKVLYAYITGSGQGNTNQVNFYVGGASSGMYLIISSIKADVYYLGQPMPPEIYDDAPYGVDIYNPNPYPVHLYINGTYYTSEQDQERYDEEYFSTIDAYSSEYWSGTTDEFLSANLDFYFAGGGIQASDAENFSY